MSDDYDDEELGVALSLLLEPLLETPTPVRVVTRDLANWFSERYAELPEPPEGEPRFECHIHIPTGKAAFIKQVDIACWEITCRAIAEQCGDHWHALFDVPGVAMDNYPLARHETLPEAAAAAEALLKDALRQLALDVLSKTDENIH